MTSIAVAAVLGLALFPLLLVFPPIYFPWAVLAVIVAGLGLGLTISTSIRGALIAPALGALMLITALLALGRFAIAPGAYLSLFASVGWLVVPAIAGTVVGAALRRRLGVVRAAAVLVPAVLIVTLLGAILAVAAAPAEAANAPVCEREADCARIRCWLTAERRRLWAVERVTEFRDGGAITCTYTAWGGADIGSVRDGGWTDGAWPRLLGSTRP